MDPRLAELLRGGGDGDARGLMEQLRRHAAENPELTRIAAAQAAREAGVDPGTLPSVDQLLGMAERQALGGGGGRFREGDRVTVRDNISLNRRLARGHM